MHITIFSIVLILTSFLEDLFKKPTYKYALYIVMPLLAFFVMYFVPELNLLSIDLDNILRSSFSGRILDSNLVIAQYFFVSSFVLKNILVKDKSFANFDITKMGVYLLWFQISGNKLVLQLLGLLMFWLYETNKTSSVSSKLITFLLILNTMLLYFLENATYSQPDNMLEYIKSIWFYISIIGGVTLVKYYKANSEFNLTGLFFLIVNLSILQEGYIRFAIGPFHINILWCLLLFIALFNIKNYKNIYLLMASGLSLIFITGDIKLPILLSLFFINEVLESNQINNEAFKKENLDYDKVDIVRYIGEAVLIFVIPTLMFELNPYSSVYSILPLVGIVSLYYYIQFKKIAFAKLTHNLSQHRYYLSRLLTIALFFYITGKDLL